MRKIFLALLFQMLLFTFGWSQCLPNQKEVIVSITPDNYPGETSWELRDGSGNILIQGDSLGASACIDSSLCLQFTIFDSYGDGICCNYGNGSYALIWDGDTLRTGGSFGFSESHVFNCNVPCFPLSYKQVFIHITPDDYPQETSWTLTDMNGNIWAQGDSLGDTVCVDTSLCLKFTILDSYGDGMCCDYGNGSYEVFFEGVLVASGGAFTHSLEHTFNCMPGMSCDNPEPTTLGSYTSTFEDHWYEFTPSQTGSYSISACGNGCTTGVWLYSQCPTGALPDNQLQALAFSDNGCGALGGAITVNLAAGTTYLIRIGDTGNACSSTTLNWNIFYNGPAVGCMDPTACNYDPLATVAGTCYYQGDPMCGNAPDLAVDEDLIHNTMYMSVMNNADQCAVNEGCVTGYNDRYILNFSTKISNIGNQDYYIGVPSGGNSQFTWDLCHNHWHYAGYAEYVLYDMAGNLVPAGFKNGFCVLDLQCAGGGIAKYSCGDMGISAGCEDIYSTGLPCQWIDITDVDTGYYTFVVRVNWDQSPDALGHYESTYANNWAQTCIHIGEDVNGNPTFSIVPNCPTFTDCAGTPFGNAVPDCAGVCNGSAVMGDIDADADRDVYDVAMYMNEIYSTTPPMLSCHDLNDDGIINVIDAALLQDCNIRGENYTPPNGGSENHCDFPDLVFGINDTATIGILNVNTVAKYVDLSIKNPTAKLLAYQFSIEGLAIDSVKNLVAYPGYEITLMVNTSTNVIEGLAETEEVIDRNYVPIPFLRVYYDHFVGSQVCVDSIHAIVNELYEDINKIKGACYLVTETETAFISEISIRPNPMTDKATVRFAQMGSKPASAQILDVTGRVVRAYHNLQNGEFEIEKGELSKGVYILQLQGQNVKFVVE